MHFCYIRCVGENLTTYSTRTNSELDEVVRQYLHSFPSAGEAMTYTLSECSCTRVTSVICAQSNLIPLLFQQYIGEHTLFQVQLNSGMWMEITS